MEDTMHLDPVFLIFGYQEYLKQDNSPSNRIQQPNIVKNEHTEITTKSLVMTRGGNKKP